LLIGILITNKN